MAASSDKYSTDVQRATQGIYALLPLSLAEYGGKNGAKALFYLDEIKEEQDRSNRSIFYGLIKPNSANYNMHAASRHGRMRYTKDNINYVVCNDGGLNTYAKININTTPINKAANYVKVAISGKSAYYSSTNKVGVKIQNVTKGFTYTQEAGGNIAKNLSFGYEVLIDNVESMEANDHVKITAYATNEEGENLSTEIADFNLTAAAVILRLTKIANKTTPLSSGEVYTGIIYADDYTKSNGLNALFSNPAAKGNNAVVTDVLIHGNKGEDNVTDATFTTLLGAGCYYGVPYNDGLKIVYLNSNGRVTGWDNLEVATNVYDIYTTIDIIFEPGENKKYLKGYISASQMPLSQPYASGVLQELVNGVWQNVNGVSFTSVQFGTIETMVVNLDITNRVFSGSSLRVHVTDFNPKDSGGNNHVYEDELELEIE